MQRHMPSQSIMANHTKKRVNVTSVIPTIDDVDRFLLNMLGGIMQRMQSLPRGYQNTVAIILTILVTIILLLQLVKYIRKYATQRNATKLQM